MKFYLLVLSLMSMTLSLSAQSSEENKSTPTERVQVPEILTKIGLLQGIEVDGHLITFKGVRSDGRCPKKITCVWAGEAEILIEINDGTETVAKHIVIPAMGTHSEILSTSTHTVYLKNLRPYPVNAGEDIEDYQLVLKIVTKNA
ncbi:hypothetical protein G3567_11230 [Psychroflexus sp. YR1-1]|uniref:Uncharacterized protein n=1 Tax=Psychroflexus aurantiacus TaxID=2709310 RepID=A0A6B3R240_9FLAO|nr:hypothetical protein [Psychroflexus aurantiacus]NEV94716.1 hypothetical protein [Psychroflexus aurantiacus]